MEGKRLQDNEFTFERRRRFPRVYTAPFNGEWNAGAISGTTAGSTCATTAGDAYGPPYICCVAGGLTPGPLEVASCEEYFNKDPFTFFSRGPFVASGFNGSFKSGDTMWQCPMYVDVLMLHAPLLDINPVDGAYVGVSIGNLGLPPLGSANNLLNVHLALLYRTYDRHWLISICNKFSPSGRKQTIIDLGANPGTLGDPTGNAAIRMEIMYYPNDRVEFYLDSMLVYTHRDATDPNGLNHLKAIYMNRQSAGETIKGMCIFATTGNDPAAKTVGVFCFPYAETLVPVPGNYVPYPSTAPPNTSA